MKPKKKNTTDKKLQEAQDFIEPYIDMVFCFTAEMENTEEIDQLIADWGIMACTLKMLHPELEIIDLLPQNLDKTMVKVNFGEGSIKKVLEMGMGL